MLEKHASFGSIETLTELLNWRSVHTPDHTAFIVEDKPYSYCWLWKNCKSFAGTLKQSHIKKNDRILVLVPNSAEFFIAFYGSILCGAIVVPVFSYAGTERCGQILNLCKGRHLILPGRTSDERKSDFHKWARVKGITLHWVDKSYSEPEKENFPKISPDDIAFIQYTSGSTDFPKGVPLSHFNLLSNIKQMVDAMKITPKDTFVSWLPVYHDMGLILNTMVPFYTGAGLVLLAEGLHKVHSWLKSIEKYKGTFVSAPDIAYRLCVKSIRRPEDYDISSLRVALNASERIQLSTYSLFENTFGLKNVMSSGYGLAEATVAVTMHPPGIPPVADSNGYVASGKALKGIEIKIKREGIESEKSGEILVKSKSLMKGYFNGKGKNPIDKTGFLHTGDIGYLNSEGHLFVLARKKNCIKHAGHTIYPDDIEQVARSVKGIRHAAAVGIESPLGNGESLYILAESGSHRVQASAFYHEIAIEIVQKSYAHFGVRPGKIFIVKPKTIPRTPNGKFQHSKLKKMVVSKSKQFVENILYPDFIS